jgi:hypothetical protein
MRPEIGRLSNERNERTSDYPSVATSYERSDVCPKRPVLNRNNTSMSWLDNRLPAASLFIPARPGGPSTAGAPATGTRKTPCGRRLPNDRALSCHRMQNRYQHRPGPHTRSIPVHYGALTCPLHFFLRVLCSVSSSGLTCGQNPTDTCSNGAAIFGYDLGVIAYVLVAPDFIATINTTNDNYVGFIVSSLLLGYV